MCIRDRICIDCDIDFTLEDARINNLYTPEAYQHMKQLEFKSILQKFDADVFSASKVEEHFKTVSELSEAEKIFSEAAGKQEAGMQLVIENGQVAAMALCYGEEKIYSIPAAGFITCLLYTSNNRITAEFRGKRDTYIDNPLFFIAEYLGPAGGRSAVLISRITA